MGRQHTIVAIATITLCFVAIFASTGVHCDTHVQQHVQTERERGSITIGPVTALVQERLGAVVSRPVSNAEKKKLEEKLEEKKRLLKLKKKKAAAAAAAVTAAQKRSHAAAAAAAAAAAKKTAVPAKKPHTASHAQKHPAAAGPKKHHAPAAAGPKKHHAPAAAGGGHHGGHGEHGHSKVEKAAHLAHEAHLPIHAYHDIHSAQHGHQKPLTNSMGKTGASMWTKTVNGATSLFNKAKGHVKNFFNAARTKAGTAAAKVVGAARTQASAVAGAAAKAKHALNVAAGNVQSAAVAAGAKFAKAAPKTAAAVKTAAHKVGNVARAAGKGFAHVTNRVGARAGPAVGNFVAKVAQNAPGIANTAAKTAAASGKVLAAGGRALVSQTSANILRYGAAGLSGIHAYQGSDQTSQGGRITEGVGVGASRAMMYGSLPVTIADMALPKGVKPSEIYDSLANTAGAIVDTAKGDGLALNRVNDANQRGDHGKIIQEASRLGQGLSDTGELAYGALRGQLSQQQIDRRLNDIHARNLAGKNGLLMREGARAGEYWADRGVRQGLADGWDAAKWGVGRAASHTRRAASRATSWVGNKLSALKFW
jgi:hypothetical protein